MNTPETTKPATSDAGRNSVSDALVAKLWNFCNLLRDDGLSYGDYVQQLTNLLFLKMADERTQPPYNKPSVVPEELSWQTLMARDGEELERHYRHVLDELGKKSGTLGVIFRKSQNQDREPRAPEAADRRPD